MCLKGDLLRVAICIAALLFLQTGCGTTMKVDNPVALQSSTSANPAKYILGECLVKDNRATGETCEILMDHVQYGLLVNGIQGDKENAEREIKFTISYYQKNVGAMSRAMLGPLAGKEGMDILVDIIDRRSGKTISSASVSYYAFIGNRTEEMMADTISKKVIEYVATGKTD